MNKSEILHQVYKNAETISLQVIIDEVADDNIRVDKIVEAMNAGAVALIDKDPMNQGDTFLVRYPDNSYHSLFLGSTLEIAGEDFYTIDSYETLTFDAGVFEEYIKEIQS